MGVDQRVLTRYIPCYNMESGHDASAGVIHARFSAEPPNEYRLDWVLLQTGTPKRGERAGFETLERVLAEDWLRASGLGTIASRLGHARGWGPHGTEHPRTAAPWAGHLDGKRFGRPSDGGS